MRSLIPTLLLLSWTCFSPISDASITGKPILRIDPEGHHAATMTIDASAKLNLFVTGSLDKTVKIWNRENGGLIRTIRLPIGNNKRGQVFDLAIHENRRIVFVAGHTWSTNDTFIYGFDLNTGELAESYPVPGGHAVHRVSISRDGRYVAAGLHTGRVRIIDLEKRSILPGEHFNICSSGRGSRVYGVAWSSRGQLAAGCQDGTIVLFSPDLKDVALRRVGSSIRDLSFAPSGERIAIAGNNTARITVLDAQTLEPMEKQPKADDSANGGSIGFASRLEWSTDGTRLIAAGMSSGLSTLTFWDGDRLGAPLSTISIGNSRVTHLSPLPDGQVAYSLHSPEFGVVSEDGSFSLKRESDTIDFRNKSLFVEDPNSGLWLSDDASVVSIPLDRGSGRRILFDLASRAIVPEAGDEKPLHRTRFMSPEVRLSTVRGDGTPQNQRTAMIAGRPLGLSIPDEVVRCWAIDEERRRIAVGTGWGIYLYDFQGEPLWNAPILTPSYAWQVALSRDGRFIVAAIGDGTIRWYRVDEGAAPETWQLSLFINRLDERWVSWTSEGFFDASVGGEDLIGWHLNQGDTREPLFYGASRFRDQFYRPDLVSNVLATDRKEVESGYEKVAEKPLPIVRMLDVSEPQDGRVVLRYQVESPSGKPIKDLRLLVNGRHYDLSGTRNTTSTDVVHELEVKLQDGDQVFSASASTEDGYGEQDTRGTAVAYEADAPEERKLFALIIGISDYEDDSIPKLSFADNDARDVEAALGGQKGQLYADVEVKSLVDEQAERSNILDALDWLTQTPRDKDVSLLYIAGHGQNQLRPGQNEGETPAGPYYFLPYDAGPRLASTGVSYASILEYVQFARGRKLLFLDTCHSGQVDVNGVVIKFSLDENGVIVFASSTGAQVSMEDPSWANGAFTEAFLEGLEGKADDPRLPDSFIDHVELGGWFSLRVKMLTEERQTPIMGTSKAIPATTIAAVVGASQ